MKIAGTVPVEVLELPFPCRAHRAVAIPTLALRPIGASYL
jgi:hypothetical protein